MDVFSIGACCAELLTPWDEDEANSDMYWDTDESDESFSTAVDSVNKEEDEEEELIDQKVGDDTGSI